MKNYFSKLNNLQLAIISGVLIGISFHPIHLGILVYIGFIPIFHSWFVNTPKSNFFSGYIFGITYNLISNYWMATNSGAEFIVVLLSLIAATVYLSIFWALAGFIVGFYENISIKILIMPFLIISLEWVRSFGPLGFAWGNLAVTQMDMIHLLQFIEYGGTYIITLWIVSINLVIYYHFFKRSFSKQKLVMLVAVLLGINAKEAARFSFLMAIPVISGAGLLTFIDANHSFSILPSVGFASLISSFIVGIVALKWLLKWLAQGKFHYFGFYCILIGMFSLVS